MMPVGPRVYAGAPVSEEGFYAYLVDLFERINIMGSHVRCERLPVDALFGRAYSLVVPDTEFRLYVGVNGSSVRVLMWLDAEHAPANPESEWADLFRMAGFSCSFHDREVEGKRATVCAGHASSPRLIVGDPIEEQVWSRDIAALTQSLWRRCFDRGYVANAFVPNLL